jgi:hypothetical protein
VPGTIKGVVYDDEETPLRDIETSCKCLTADVSVTTLSTVYGNPAFAPNGTYTEFGGFSSTVGDRSFVAWRAIRILDGSLPGGNLDDWSRVNSSVNPLVLNSPKQ